MARRKAGNQRDAARKTRNGGATIGHETELRGRANARTVRIGAPNRPDLYLRPPRLLPSGIVQELLDEVRGDR